MKYACVTTNSLDLWTHPEYDSERASQLLYNELVTLGRRKAGFVRVTQADGYKGWTDERFLFPLKERGALTYRRSVNAVVISSQVRPTTPPHLLYYGTRLHCKGRRDGLAHCSLADGSSLILSAKAIALFSGIKGKDRTAAAIPREARRFLGVPYLWGGITPAGFDCSGLVRAVFGRFGIHLPRDTKDQIRAGQKIARDDIKPGDLLFFRRHVGIAIGRDRLIHASRGGGGVRVNSLSASRADYRADLDRDFAMARRVL